MCVFFHLFMYVCTFVCLSGQSGETGREGRGLGKKMPELRLHNDVVQILCRHYVTCTRLDVLNRY